MADTRIFDCSFAHCNYNTWTNIICWVGCLASKAPDVVDTKGGMMGLRNEYMSMLIYRMESYRLTLSLAWTILICRKLLKTSAEKNEQYI
jgi:hypothetical protein